MRFQVSDSERLLAFNVAQQFINVLFGESTLEFAQQDLESFQKTVDISDVRWHAGDMSEGDFLKIKLQLLQFQTDVSSAKLARVQALAGLRQFPGFESVPGDYDVTGDLDYQQATRDASLLRLRPIMITALVACLGLLPAAISTGVGSDTQKPLAIVVVAGLISRLVVGFFINPVLYEVAARDGDRLQV